MKTELLPVIRTITHATLAVTCLALCLPYALHGEWLWALAALWLCAMVIPVPNLPSWGRALGDVTFAGAVILAASAAARPGHTMWALIAVAAATATWDLQHLIHRLRPFEPATQKSPASESASASELAPTAELAPTSESAPTSELAPASELAPTSELAESAPTTPAQSDRGRLARSASAEEQSLEEPDARSALVRAHLQRLGITLGISLALGSIALVARVDYSIRTIAILTLILLVGLGGAVAYLRRVSD